MPVILSNEITFNLEYAELLHCKIFVLAKYTLRCPIYYV
jgi:hypothetical protein